jgi:hypothetical protein
MKKSLSVLLLVLWVTAAAFAWGPTGHRAMGKVAEQYLNPKAKKRIAAILQQESLAMVSTWIHKVCNPSCKYYTKCKYSK